MSFNELQADIAAFRSYMLSERGMSDNTVQAYGRDIIPALRGLRG